MGCDIENADMATPRGSKQFRENRRLSGKRQGLRFTQDQWLAGASVNALTPSHLSLLAHLEAQRAHDARRRG